MEDDRRGMGVGLGLGLALDSVTAVATSARVLMHKCAFCCDEHRNKPGDDGDARIGYGIHGSTGRNPLPLCGRWGGDRIKGTRKRGAKSMIKGILGYRRGWKREGGGEA